MKEMVLHFEKEDEYPLHSQGRMTIMTSIESFPNFNEIGMNLDWN